jgi:hypothetical protein
MESLFYSVSSDGKVTKCQTVFFSKKMKQTFFYQNHPQINIAIIVRKRGFHKRTSPIFWQPRNIIFGNPATIN